MMVQVLPPFLHCDTVFLIESHSCSHRKEEHYVPAFARGFAALESAMNCSTNRHNDNQDPREKDCPK